MKFEKNKNYNEMPIPPKCARPATLSGNIEVNKFAVKEPNECTTKIIR